MPSARVSSWPHQAACWSCRALAPRPALCLRGLPCRLRSTVCHTRSLRRRSSWPLLECIDRLAGQPRPRRTKELSWSSRLSRLGPRSSRYIRELTSLEILVKRIHEYKRQHLCVLYILTLYLRLKRDPRADFPSRTFVIENLLADRVLGADRA